jgi:hypothetical protein
MWPHECGGHMQCSVEELIVNFENIGTKTRIYDKLTKLNVQLKNIGT